MAAFIINYHQDYIKHLQELIEHYKQIDKNDPNVPPECNRYTNSPCEWSGTSQMSNICVKCKRQFPEWS